MNRRNFIKSTGGILVAPWVVRAESLMPIKVIDERAELIDRILKICRNPERPPVIPPSSVISLEQWAAQSPYKVN